jgi:hypothetical protein
VRGLVNSKGVSRKGAKSAKKEREDENETLARSWSSVIFRRMQIGSVSAKLEGDARRSSLRSFLALFAPLREIETPPAAIVFPDGIAYSFLSG